MLARTSFSLLLIWGVGVFLTISGTTTAVIPETWKVEFFENFNCDGENMTIVSTDDGLDAQWATNASSVRVVGLWKLTIYKTLEDGSQRGVIITFENAQPEMQQCFNKNDLITTPDFPDHRFYHAEVIAFTPSPHVIVSTEENFKGLRYHFGIIVNNGTVVPKPTTMESLLLFGKYPWLVYPESDFQGTPMCVHPRSDINTSVDGSYTVVRPWKEVVGSARIEENGECTSAGASCNTISILLIFLTVSLNFMSRTR